MIVRPSMTVLDKEQQEQVHAYSMDILSTTGIQVDSKSARDLFKSNGCPLKDDNRVLLPPEMVNWAIAAAPTQIDIFKRDGQKAFTLGSTGNNKTRFGIGVTNLYYQHPDNDQVIPFTLNHLKSAVQLGSCLPGFDLISTPGIAQDLDPQTADLFATLTMIANTIKPLVLLISEQKMFLPALDLLEKLHGDLSIKPFVIPYFNPITPLVLNEETVSKMVATIERGLPFIYNNYGMSGATAPITPGSTLALLNAELLAGLLFSQLVKKGTPIILGSLPAGFDMRSMMSQYTPHTYLLNLACAEMMAFYEIPHSGTSGSGPGWGPDLLAAEGLWMNHLTACMGKVGLAPFVGGNFDSLAFSPAMVVLADEIIRLVGRFSEGFSLDPEQVALSEIEATGPAGNFLTTDMTLQLFRRLPFASPIWPVMALDQWETQNRPTAEARLRQHTIEILEQLKPPLDHTDLMERGKLHLDDSV